MIINSSPFLTNSPLPHYRPLSPHRPPLVVCTYLPRAGVAAWGIGYLWGRIPPIESDLLLFVLNCWKHFTEYKVS